MSDKLQEVQRHSQANSGNVMAAKATAEVFAFANTMDKHSASLTSLAEKVNEANPKELQRIAENILDVCENCNKTRKSFANSAKSVTNAVSSLVEKVSPETGQVIKDNCTDFLDRASGAKQTALVQNQLKECLTQEVMNQESILEQIQQQQQHIDESVQSAYQFASYFNFLTALINFGMAIMALNETCNLIKGHKKIMEDEKRKLEECSSVLKNYHEQTEELMKSLRSISAETLTISDPMYQGLYDLSDSIRDIQLDLERIKSALNIAITEVQSQKKLHSSGAWAGGIGAVISIVASVGQKANFWNIGAATFNIACFVVNRVGVQKCKTDINSLQELTDCTEILIHNANESMKLIKSAKKKIIELKTKEN